MATIDSREHIDRIIAKGGREYPDEPPVIKIVEYTNNWGNVTWGVIWKGEDPFKYAASPFVRKPRTIWCGNGWSEPGV